jgi:hypothetical protein
MRTRTLLLGALCAAAIGAALPDQARAQTIVAEAALHTLSIGDGNLTQMVVPVGVTWRLAGLRFDANAAYADATYEVGGESSELSGLTDLTLRVLVPMMRDRARLILAGNIPTGTETLTEAQLPVAAVLTTDLLTMPVRTFGSGAGVTAGVALAQPVGDWIAGGIVVYRMGGAYEPIAPAAGGAPGGEFRPGSEFRMRLGLERPRIGGTTWRLAGSWSRFAPDAADGSDLFARGDRLLGEAVAEFPFGRGAATMYGWGMYRSESEIFAGPEPEMAPSSTLAGVGGVLAHPVTATFTLRPRAELLVQRGEPGFGSGNGWIARAGSGASFRLGSMRVDPAVLVQVGGLEDDDVFGLVLRGGILWER